MKEINSEVIGKLFSLKGDLDALQSKVNTMYTGVDQMRRKMALREKKKEVMYLESQGLMMYFKGVLDKENAGRVEDKFPELVKIQDEYQKVEKEYKSFIKVNFGFDNDKMTFVTILTMVMQIVGFMVNDPKAAKELKDNLK